MFKPILNKNLCVVLNLTSIACWILMCLPPPWPLFIFSPQNLSKAHMRASHGSLACMILLLAGWSFICIIGAALCCAKSGEMQDENWTNYICCAMQCNMNCSSSPPRLQMTFEQFETCKCCQLPLPTASTNAPNFNKCISIEFFNMKN